MLHLLKYLLIIPVVLALLLGLLWVIDLFISSKVLNIQYGVTFSSRYAKELGFAPNEVYQAILKDLNVKYLRIPVYWEEVEPIEGKFDFQAIDALLDEAHKNNAQVTLAIGYKVPRWPECFPPPWAKKMDKDILQPKILMLLGQTIDHFKNRQEITAWQVENEPFFPFGICKTFSTEFLEQEVSLVKGKDTRPIILTDAGEPSIWTTSIRLSDMVGTSLYRKVWNPIFGYFDYPIPPAFYHLKAWLFQGFSFNPNKVFIAELQTEPWTPGVTIPHTQIDQQMQILSLKQFQDTVEYASKTGMGKQYLWGVEWWYYMKVRGHPEYWEYAKTLFR